MYDTASAARTWSWHTVRARGHRPAPTPRYHEYRALAATQNAFADGAKEHRQPVRHGALSVRRIAHDHWRIALFNAAGARVAVGSAFGAFLGVAITRTIAEVLRQAPQGADRVGSARPRYDVRAVGDRMLMQRTGRTPAVRGDGSLTVTVPGADIRITASKVHATASGGGVWLSLEGAWVTDPCAKVADAMLRDHAPQARHLTRTTGARGYYLNESGSRCYDGSSWALCSCGWSCCVSDRAMARATARWHVEHPALYHPALDVRT